VLSNTSPNPLIVVTVRFTQTSYSGNELSGVINVGVELVGGESSVPFDVIITPSQQSPPSATGNDVQCDNVLIMLNTQLVMTLALPH